MRKDTLPFLLIGLFLACILILDAMPAPSLSTPEASVSAIPTETQPPVETTAPQIAAVEETVPPTTEAASTDAPAEAPTEPEQFLSFNTYDITFRVKGDSWEVYNGTVPKDSVKFYSDNTAVATFENGVVTAVGAGTTYIHAEYADQSVQCIIRNVLSSGNGGSTNTETISASREPVMELPEVFDGPSEFFNDAVFVGDSVTYMLYNHVLATGDLGSVQFLVRGSYSVFHAVNHTMMMNFRGKETPLQDAIAGLGAKKVFFMLGTNDIGAYGINKTMANWETLISRIREKSPDIQIYIQSMTPVWTGGEKGSLNNTNADVYNEYLMAFCAENDCTYVDIASYMKDSTGGLATKYCSDSYVHLTYEGAAAWVAVLKNFAGC